MTPSQPNTETNSIAEVLRKALDIFGPNGEHWVKIGHLSDVDHCAITACDYAASIIHRDGTLRKTLELLDGMTAPESVDDWQDKPERTFPEVKALFEKAIAAAEAQ